MDMGRGFEVKGSEEGEEGEEVKKAKRFWRTF